MKVEILHIYTDGASRGNPGASSVGIVIYDADNKELERYKEDIGISTNNIAEYSAVIKSLEMAKKYQPSQVKLFSDSQLVINQLKGEWKVKTPHIWDLLNQVRALEKELCRVEYVHVRREFNKLADRLANEALDGV